MAWDWWKTKVSDQAKEKEVQKTKSKTDLMTISEIFKNYCTVKGEKIGSKYYFGETKQIIKVLIAVEKTQCRIWNPETM